MRFNEAKCSLGRSSNYTLLECNSGHIFLSNSNREVTESGPDASESPNLSLSPAGLGVRLQRRVCRAFVHMLPARLPRIEMCADRLLSSKFQKNPNQTGKGTDFYSTVKGTATAGQIQKSNAISKYFFGICPVGPPRLPLPLPPPTSCW